LRRRMLARTASRAQSAILDKNQPKAVVAFIHNRVFRTDVLLIRPENTVGARSAQWPLFAYDGIYEAA
jgi:hypothetical protein